MNKTSKAALVPNHTLVVHRDDFLFVWGCLFTVVDYGWAAVAYGE